MRMMPWKQSPSQISQGRDVLPPSHSLHNSAIRQTSLPSLLWSRGHIRHKWQIPDTSRATGQVWSLLWKWESQPSSFFPHLHKSVHLHGLFQERWGVNLREMEMLVLWLGGQTCRVFQWWQAFLTLVNNLAWFWPCHCNFSLHLLQPVMQPMDVTRGANCRCFGKLSFK